MKALRGLIRTVGVLLVMAGLNGGANAASVSFAWKANTEPELAGYKLYRGTAPGTYSSHVVLGLVTNHTVTDLVAGTTYYFALSAFDTNDMESGLTPELQFPASPTLATIANQSTSEDTALAVNLTVSDPDTAVANLTLSAISTNLTLVPNGNITFAGTTSSRTMTITPAANQSGTTRITVTVSDGGRTASRNFILTVNGSADAPTISSIGDVTTDEDVQTAAIAFTIGDADTPVANLTLRATSSNASLIPTNRITLGGTGNSRTVTLRPTTNQSGSASITLTVSDGALSSSTSFNFTVRAVNDPPTITPISNVTVAEDTATSAIAFTINDVETAAASLQVTRSSSNPPIVPEQNVYLNGGTGTNRTVVVSPVTNAVGNSVITITVSDGQASVSEAFTVAFTAVNDAPIVSQPADIVVNKFNPVPEVNFTVWDPEGTPVSITFGSTNQTLLPLTNIVMSGSGTNRTLTLTPLGIGMTRIAINANDGASTNRVFFHLTVTGSNNPPVLTVPSGLAGTAGALIDLRGISVADPDLKTNNMNLTITAPNGSVTVATTVANGVRAAQVSGNNSGAVTIIAPMAALNATFAAANGVTYRSRADFTGTETLVVTASDNGFTGLGGIKTDSENLIVQITGSTSTGIQAWRAANFSAADLQDPTKEATVWGDLADPDNDGRQNLMEYALGLNPLASEPQDSALLSQMVGTSPNQQQTLTFNARVNDRSLQYITEVSADNATWSPTATLIASTPVNIDFTRVTYRDPVAVTSLAARFVRLRVVATNPVEVVSESFVGSAATLAGVQGTATERTSFLSSRAVRPAVYAGKVTATAATSITDANANWTSAQFTGRAPLYAEFANGVEADIQQVSFGPKRLTFSGTLPASITVGTAYRIREHHTVGEVFGTANQAGLLAGANDAAAEVIFHFDAETQQRRTYYYLNFSGISGWVQLDYSPASNVVIYPEQGLMVRRLTPGDITLASSGPLKPAPSTIFVYPGNNLLGVYNRATPVSLDSLNLVAAGITGAGSPDAADLIRKISPDGLSTTYFYINLTGFEGWYDTGYQPAGHVTLSPGAVFILYRRSTSAIEWTLPAQ